MALPIPELLRPHLARPVAILGGGASGQGARALVAALGGTSATYDARGAEFTAAAAASHGLVVFSPGFAPDHPWLARAAAAGAILVGEVDFAALCWRGRIVAITGTNGKTTLTEFLAHALLAIGREAAATGNIGRAFSGVAAAAGGRPDAIAVCEVSSFQAETLRHFRAEAALWTNFAEDHLERHRSLKAYFAAKDRLAELSGTVFAGSSVRAFAEPGEPRPNIIWVPTAGQPADPALAGTVFADYPQRENFLLAAAWWRAAGLDPAALYAAARTFRLGRHRLARVAEVDGVTFWNDSKATNFHAVEAALARFPRPVLLIAGGRAKGGDLAGFARRIAPRVRRAFLIGETGPALAAELAAAGVPAVLCPGLGEAVRRAADEAGPGDQVLLSPGFASFDQFKGYEDRGDQFEQAVHFTTRPSLSLIP
jgi:UDP-N-acetylmuramoylalanine--D-glutamate ligase